VIAAAEHGLISVGVRLADGSFAGFDAPERMSLTVEIECVQRGAVSADGRTLCVTSGKGAACVLRFDDPSRSRLLGDPRLGVLAVSRDGRFIAGCDKEHSGVALWDLQVAESPTLIFEDETIASLAFDPQRDELVVDNGQQVVGYDVLARRVIARVDLPETGSAPNWRGEMSLANTGLCAVSRPGYRIALFDWRRRELVATLPAELPNASVSLSPDGRQLLCTGADFALQSWDLGAIRVQLDEWGLDW
jgi:WD40 repeat protein